MSDAQRYTPASQLMEVLLPAYPCAHFSGNCKDVARWDPDAGFVPRGFVGALGALEDVKLVLLLAEPGNGLPGETHPYHGDPRAFIAELSAYVYRQFDRPASVFHHNMRYILDQCWPGRNLRQQLTRTWITETYLCSAPFTTGPVPSVSWRTCRANYLERQLELLPGRVVVALGGKAQERSGALAGVHRALSPAPPGCNQRAARPSWNAIATLVRDRYPA